MEHFTIPATVFVALGAIIAALLAGFFSFVSLVSAKENKVSEFRLDWINGLREEIAEFTAAAQELGRINSFKLFPIKKDTPESELSSRQEYFKETKDMISKAVENLSRIQLRLNPEDILKNPESSEAKLMEALATARNLTIKGDLDDILTSCNNVRLAAAPILKNTWNLVKLGEPGYRSIRKYALYTVAGGFYLILTTGLVIGIYTTAMQHTPEKASPHDIAISIQNKKPWPLDDQGNSIINYPENLQSRNCFQRRQPLLNLLMSDYQTYISPIGNKTVDCTNPQ